MSQHYFSTIHNGDQPVTVTLGWDRPLGDYFMFIERDGADDEPLYSSVDEKHPFNKTPAFYKTKLGELGIQVPKTMFEQIQCDQALGVGNRYARYAADGTFVDMG